MIVGMHLSVAGRYSNAIAKAHSLGCNALQIFAQNPKGWSARSFAPGEVDEFRKLASDYGVEAIVIHTPYLINLASPNGRLVRNSRDAIRNSLERADILGAQYVATHIGSSRGRDLDDAIRAVSEGLDEILETRFASQLLLENTAGSGNIIGASFEELARIIEGSEFSDRLGVCLDTAHAYAAGYDVASGDGLERTVEEFDRHLRLERLKVIHTNDTRVALGSRIDRHWHIGQGSIGIDGFRRIAGHPVLTNLPFILETPVTEDGDDEKNLEAFRALFSMR
ncbi:MAG: deoxyribonuclease IV [Candidatus Coatesbacteria bacterium]|nr:deoxyribonuclease IV [Candidatus Coatesbacteria bacterium]